MSNSHTILDTDLAYLAGLIDGEGCISIEKYTAKMPRKTARYTLKVEFQMSDDLAIKHISNLFGIAIMRKRKSSNMKKEAFRVSWQAIKAKNILLRVLPFLILKKSQAEVGIRFQEFQSSILGGKTLNQETLDKKHDYYLLLRQLKYQNQEGSETRDETSETSNVVDDDIVQTTTCFNRAIEK